MRGIDNEPVIMGSNPGYGGFGGGIGELIALMALMGRRGFGGDEGGHRREDSVLAGDVAAKVVELQNTSDLKAEVKGVEAGLRESLLNQTIGFGNEFRGLEGRIDHAALDAVKAQFEAKIASLEATNKIEGRMNAFEVNTDRQFCSTNHNIEASERRILEKLNLNILEQKNDEIAQLREDKRGLTQSIVFGNQLNAINSQLNEMAQNIRATNQTIQLGTGNLATPTATNTNVKG